MRVQETEGVRANHGGSLEYLDAGSMANLRRWAE